jgi:hypothetical protein
MTRQASSDLNRLESARVVPLPASVAWWTRSGLGHFYPGNVALLLFKFETGISLNFVI